MSVPDPREDGSHSQTKPRDFPDTELALMRSQLEALKTQISQIKGGRKYVGREKPRNRLATLAGVVAIIVVGSWLSKNKSALANNTAATHLDADLSETDERGRDADTPEAIPKKGLRDVFWRVVAAVKEDRITLVAAGVTYYLLLALFPALAALVSLYGLVADPTQIGSHLASVSEFLPAGSFNLLLDQLKALTEQKTSSLGIAFFGGLAIALWSARSGTIALFDAMNIAYEEREKRGVVWLNVIAICFTLGALVIAGLLVGAVAAVPVVLSLLSLDRWTTILALVLRWPILIAIVSVVVTLIYRIGPSRAPAKLRWINWGTSFTTIAWIVTSLALSYYLNNFANYSATYGTLGALIGLMVWMWISIVILIVGAEINAQLELQTAQDTTTGTPLPMGARGAFVADTLGQTIE